MPERRFVLLMLLLAGACSRAAAAPLFDERDVLRGAIRHVSLARDEIIGLVGDTPGLSERDAERTVDYLMGYFERADDEEKLLVKFEKKYLGH